MSSFRLEVDGGRCPGLAVAGLSEIVAGRAFCANRVTCHSRVADSAMSAADRILLQIPLRRNKPGLPRPALHSVLYGMQAVQPR